MVIKIPLKATLVAIVLFVSIVLWGNPSYALVYSNTGTPLRKADFKIDLDKNFIRQIDPLFLKADSTSEADFSKKWNKSLEDQSIQFFRSYPPAYHHDLAQIPTNKIPGEEGLCFGDAHPENFGFLNLAHESIFAYNDLDDSGYCPIAYDALRFFTALRLWFDDDALTQDVLQKYIDVVKKSTRALTMSPLSSSDWKQEVKNELAKKTNENLFKYSKDKDDSLKPISVGDSRRIDILEMANKDQHLANYKILDIASREKNLGGSSSLKRYWLLVENQSGKRSIFELKEAPRPGVEYGRTSQVLSMDSRLPMLKSTFWNDDSDDDNFYVTVSGTRFLVRSRLAMKGVKMADNSCDNDCKDLLQAEASLMATVHSAHWDSVEKDALQIWLWESSETLSKRWQSVYERYH